MKKTIANFGDKLTSIGERYSCRPLIYNPITWGRFLFQSRRYGRIFAEVIRSEFPEILTSLDVGSGGGGYVYHLKRLGLRASGVEYSVVGRFLGFIQGVSIEAFDCSRKEYTFNRQKYDLVYSIEVGEHLAEEMADSFVNYIVIRGNIILFSAAHPGQGGQGHINEQPKEYWRRKFEGRGFTYQKSQSETIKAKLLQSGYKGWLPENLMVFRTLV